MSISRCTTDINGAPNSDCQLTNCFNSLSPAFSQNFADVLGYWTGDYNNTGLSFCRFFLRDMNHYPYNNLDNNTYYTNTKYGNSIISSQNYNLFDLNNKIAGNLITPNSVIPDVYSMSKVITGITNNVKDIDIKFSINDGPNNIDATGINALITKAKDEVRNICIEIPGLCDIPLINECNSIAGKTYNDYLSNPLLLNFCGCFETKLSKDEKSKDGTIIANVDPIYNESRPDTSTILFSSLCLTDLYKKDTDGNNIPNNITQGFFKPDKDEVIRYHNYMNNVGSICQTRLTVDETGRLKDDKGNITNKINVTQNCDLCVIYVTNTDNKILPEFDDNGCSICRIYNNDNLINTTDTSCKDVRKIHNDSLTATTEESFIHKILGSNPAKHGDNATKIFAIIIICIICLALIVGMGFFGHRIYNKIKTSKNVVNQTSK